MNIENWTIEEETGYRPVTTFYQDFSIAEHYGEDAIRDTYARAFNEWKGNREFVTELALVLNWKCWRWYRVRDNFSALYDELWRRLDTWIMDNLKGEDLDYYIRTTD